MRVNLYAGPGSGKSTLAAYIFSKMKVAGINVEHVSEYIKNWAYEKKDLKGCDQFYVFAKQWRREDIILRNGVDVVVTDSPLLLQSYYSNKYGAEGKDEILSAALMLEQKGGPYQSLNIFINRMHGTYQEKGRYQTESEACEIDKEIKFFLKKNSVPFHEMDNDLSIVTEFCLRKVGG